MFARYSILLIIAEGFIIFWYFLIIHPKTFDRSLITTDYPKIVLGSLLNLKRFFLLYFIFKINLILHEAYLFFFLSLHDVYKRKEHFRPLNSRRYYHDSNRMFIFHFFCEQSIILMDPIRAVLPIYHPTPLLKFYSKFFLPTISSICVLFIFITYLF